jgi:hypothetical protein
MSTGRIQAQKTTFCNKCQAMVAWQRSYTSYKWYLTNVDSDGLTARADFHKCQGNHLQTVCDDTQAVIDHNAMEAAIKANRDVLNQSLNSLLVPKEAECQGDICPPTNFKPVNPIVNTIQPLEHGSSYPLANKLAKLPGKLGLYQCLSTPHTFTHLVTPGKPVICQHCNKIAEFLSITT